MPREKRSFFRKVFLPPETYAPEGGNDVDKGVPRMDLKQKSASALAFFGNLRYNEMQNICKTNADEEAFPQAITILEAAYENHMARAGGTPF